MFKCISSAVPVPNAGTGHFNHKTAPILETMTAKEVVMAVLEKHKLLKGEYRNCPGISFQSDIDGSTCPGMDFETAIEKLGFDKTDLSSLRGKRILDLACGAVGAEKTLPFDKSRDYEPWAARYFHEAGANVVGIDILPQKNESFVAHRLNLLDKGALDFLGAESFDLVICRNLVRFSGDPECDKFGSPALRGMTVASERKKMREELLSQITRVLIPGGKLCATIDQREDGLFVKKNGVLDLESTVKPEPYRWY